MNLGSRLEEILKSRNMTVTQLAREAEVSPQTLYAMIHRDSNKVDMNIMARILVALEMDLVEFVQLKAPGKLLDKQETPSDKLQKLSDKPEIPSDKPEKTTEESREIRSARKEMETYLL